MRNRRRQSGARPRRGIILLVVLALLTLFAIAGLTFVLYADATATGARIARESETQVAPDMDPELAFSIALGQMIYGAGDDGPTDAGVYSALRGNDLATNMYGFLYVSDPAVLNAPNDKPYNGPGRLIEPITLPGGVPPQSGDMMAVYTYFPADGFLRDPGRLGVRANPSAAKGAYAGGLNPGYTYPDHQNMFLAAIRSSDGQVIMPSFHRPWMGFGPLDPTNPNWAVPDATNPALKYLVMRPRPADMGPGFPLPEDAGGDVKNLDWAPGGNDSIWIDVGAPVMTAPDGRKYKMLVAPLILDLDGRVNLNVHGNVMGGPAGGAPGSAHAGAQGWGPWEVNLSKVLNANATEWPQIFAGTPAAGAPRTVGRYGPGRLPLLSPSFKANGVTPRAYAMVDLNGTFDPGKPGAYGPSPPYLLPGNGAAVPYQSFPSFDPAAFGNGIPNETSTTPATWPAGCYHPMVYNSQRPVPGNRLLPIQSMVPLLRGGGTNSDALTTDLGQLLYANLFNPADPLTVQRRNQSTLHSADLDRPTATPYVWDYAADGAHPAGDPADAAATRYGLPAGALSPVGTPIPFPLLASRGATPAAPPNVSEFDPATWRSLLAVLGRVDVNRKLTGYPTPDPTTGLIDLTVAANSTQYAQAVSDRQQLASDLFVRLRQATGALDPVVAAAAPFGPTSPEYNADRWLAQLAVNIVDYVDNDDYMTPFNWFGTEWVFGTELPRLVVNEAYVQLNNDPADPTAVNNYLMNVWVELHNPTPGPDGAGDNQAHLQIGTNPSLYEVVLTNPNANLRAPANILGDPDVGAALNVTPEKTFSLAAAAAQQTVLPAGGAYSGPAGSNQGFYVLGPTGDATVAATLQSDQMKYPVPVAVAPKPPTILLRRLANPFIPGDLNPTAVVNGQTVPNPLYNPYVTVDYVENVPIQDARATLNGGAANAALVPQVNRFSVGRKQPYAAVASQWQQQAPNPADPNGPQATFYRHNADANTPGPNSDPATPPKNYPAFTWLVHLDRTLISPGELLHVSAFKPHELTQQFVDAKGAAFGHYAPWTDQTSRLHRALDLIEAKGSASGVATGGRVPGKINLNTLTSTDDAVFQALCDAEPGNYFTPAEASAVFQNLLASRTPNGVPGPTDRPFKGFSLGAAVGGDALTALPRGIDDTILRASPAAPNLRLLEPPAPDPNNPGKFLPTPANPHPYQRGEMLTKLFNNVTVRSNVFAVWATVGFFEVTQDTQAIPDPNDPTKTITVPLRPVKLGAEIGRAENRQVRHRMFAIVDRTNLQVFSGVITANQGNPVPAGATVTLDATQITPYVDPRTGRSWVVQQGTQVVLEPNTDGEETVTLQAPTAPNVYPYTVRLPHPGSFPALIRGNPGPWLRYKPHEDPDVVKYFAIID